MKTAQIPAYKKGIKEWLEIDENDNSATGLESLSAQEREEAVKTILCVSQAYCNFQDIVSGRKKFVRSRISARQHMAELQKWVEEN